MADVPTVWQPSGIGEAVLPFGTLDRRIALARGVLLCRWIMQYSPPRTTAMAPVERARATPASLDCASALSRPGEHSQVF
jgi:hypothetical protein